MGGRTDGKWQKGGRKPASSVVLLLILGLPVDPAGLAAEPRRVLAPTPSSATPSCAGAESVVTEVAMQRALPAGGEEARRQLFDVHANASGGSLVG